VNDRHIDEVLQQAAQAPDRIEPALLQRIAGSLQPSLHPVRPLPRTWVLVSRLLLVAAGIALAGAFRAGFNGYAKMDKSARVLVFITLACFAFAAGTEFVNSVIPGSRRRVTPGNLLLIGGLVLLGVFALLFRDYHTVHFWSAGFVCLVTGILHAVPVGLIGWFLLRRGVALNRVAAGFAAGAFAGLAGIAVLELHCVNFQAFHILIWHTAVIPVSAVIGALIARVLPRSA